ncbi:PREDICTED: scopoletin glucosyltransferase-like [Nelumbo nucifera]|uniref:Glycosyltransferase n=2 Tax=Nelumbo nucifera TaxID=4432 RepID=A0A822ZHJ0_NELNU|nr:PREDICTED: scopoletin glucosyltransferase-like [Nelumbo nucifera]DAD43980.1 TPA_asm: hypothetical protein HUJ06_002210 [Nelumbo nucifera]
MGTDDKQLHVFFFPFMAPGRLLPMVDMARLFAARGVKATIITTALNLSRFQAIIDRDIQSGLQIQVHTVELPFSDAGIPEGCENVDTLPSRDLLNFSKAAALLQPQFEKLVEHHLPDAIISDMNFTWTVDIAHKHHIPRLEFNGFSCFSLCVTDSINRYTPHIHAASESEPFLVSSLPDPLYLTQAQLVERFVPGARDFLQKMQAEIDRYTSDVVINSFYELEPDYIEHYQKTSGKKTWMLGPVSLCNKDSLSKAERGKKASISQEWCLSWLDSRKPNSVLYVSFGSVCKFPKSQLKEIGLGLEASNQNFIWVIRDVDAGGLPEGFEERIQGRGLIIRGWAPQVLILEHPAIGGFMTHCGWNSTLEAVSAGQPLITWPLFAEQFYNEKFVLQRLKIGISIGVETGFVWGEEERTGALVKREKVEEVVTRLMGGGGEVEGMRKQAKKLGEMAKLAAGEGGSSNTNISLLIEHLKNQKRLRKIG